jgi:hypothetical protein
VRKEGLFLMATDFDTKLRFLAKQLAWIVIFVIISPLCLWGIYTGIQYMDDPCVRDGEFSLALDWWLIVTCVYDILFAVVVLLLLCCHTRGTIRRAIIWTMHVINILWTIVGVLLIVESNLRCQHNTLWVVSVVIVSITATVAVLLFSVWIFNRLGCCHRLGRYISLEDTPYDYIPINLNNNQEEQQNENEF